MSTALGQWPRDPPTSSGPTDLSIATAITIRRGTPEDLSAVGGVDEYALSNRKREASIKAAQALFAKTGFARSGTIDNLDDGDAEIVFYLGNGTA